MKRICLKCEKETPDTPCPYCGGGKFKNVCEYIPPEHLPPIFKFGDNEGTFGICPRCLMTNEEASKKDCFYPKWIINDIINLINGIEIKSKIVIDDLSIQI